MRTIFLSSIFILVSNLCYASTTEGLLSCKVLSNEVRLVHNGHIKKFSIVKDQFVAGEVLSLKYSLVLSHIDSFTQTESPPMYNGDKGQIYGGFYVVMKDDKRDVPFVSMQVSTINFESYRFQQVNVIGHSSLTMGASNLRLSDYKSKATLTLQNYEAEKWNGGVSILKSREVNDGTNGDVYNQYVGLDCKRKTGMLSQIFNELKMFRNLKN